jgi:tRNA(Arg) A34 adenosine deaminase TadA
MKHPNEKIMRDLIAYTIKNNKGRNDSSGCFIVKNDKIISRAVSRVGLYKDPTAHGEILAIKKACREQKNFYLKGCWIYSTQIPCPMCTSAIVWSEAKGIVWGWDGRHTWGMLNIDPKDITKAAKNKVEIIGHFLEEECLKIKGYTKK